MYNMAESVGTNEIINYMLCGKEQFTEDDQVYVGGSVALLVLSLQLKEQPEDYLGCDMKDVPVLCSSTWLKVSLR